MSGAWWKISTIVLLLYVIIGGFLIDTPELPILHETIRNLYFHVPMWFGMIIIFTVGLVYSIKYLSNPTQENDSVAVEAVNVGILFGFLGLITGMQWAQFTWGEWWSGDPKQNASAISLLIYLAYLVLRNSMDEDQKRARISAVYNIFAYAAMIPLLFVLPRLTDSLHPGSGGNPGFNVYDLDGGMRLVFYPAVIGWTLLGVWIMELRVRLRNLNFKYLYRN
ncbi:MAG: ABC transporter permease [Bacteroidetes bacterium]|nr:MAG: ABC transporter permease [Bacteroidota bacterium]